jgi:hypothetical protein
MANRMQLSPGALGWLAFAVLVLALASPAAALSAFPGANGRIAFTVVTWHPPPPPELIPPEFPHPGLPLEPIPVSARIVSVAPSGQSPRRLHAIPVEPGRFYYGATIIRPAYSPDGKLIAFDQGNRLHIMRHDGTRLRALPPLSNSDTAPAWSPNGRRLAFSGQRPCPIY